LAGRAGGISDGDGKFAAYLRKILRIWEEMDRGRLSMRIVRPEQNWRVLFPLQGDSLCLQRLALRCGYRVSEISAELECTRRYLHVVFMRDIGLPPKEWMRRERMVVARRMLTGGRTPDEVGKVLGFASQNNFRREFRETYGVRPSQFQMDRWGENVEHRTFHIEH